MLENINFQHYHMAPLEQYQQDFSDAGTEETWLKTFLIGTDYQIIKAAECQLMGQPVPEGIKMLIAARQEARARINELEATD